MKTLHKNCLSPYLQNYEETNARRDAERRSGGGNEEASGTTGPGAETEHFPACFAPIFAKAHLPAYPKATAAAAATAAAFADHPPDDPKREDRAHFMEAVARHARACVMRADAMDEIYEAERTARHAEDEKIKI